MSSEEPRWWILERMFFVFFFTYLYHLFFDYDNTYLADIGSVHYWVYNYNIKIFTDMFFFFFLLVISCHNTFELFIKNVSFWQPCLRLIIKASFLIILVSWYDKLKEFFPWSNVTLYLSQFVTINRQGSLHIFIVRLVYSLTHATAVPLKMKNP